MHKKLRVGLTGGIASGKSFVADSFRTLGAAVVDTDIIAREVVIPGSCALEEIRHAFGDDIISADGTLDRKGMRKLIFSDDSLRRQLEGILHPRIRTSTMQQIDESEGPYVIVVVPLLYESPLQDSMNRILVVDCSEETQLRRLGTRDDESIERARRIIATQATREARLSIADDVITNDGSREKTRAAVARLHAYYLRIAE